MADDNREDNKKASMQARNSSDRERIKNITNKVHPEYGNARKKTSSSDVKRKKTQNPASEERNRQKRTAGEGNERLSAADRRRIEQRRMRIRRRRRRRRILRALTLCVIIVAIGLGIYAIKNYNTGTRHDRRGITAYENGDYDTAVREFKEAISYNGKNADYYIHLGMAYIDLKAYDEALGYFNQAEVCAEDDEQNALLNRGRGIAFLYQGNYASAADAFDKVLETAGGNISMMTDCLYYKAEAEEKSGDYTAAIQSYGQIIALDDDAGARMLRGLAYMQIEDYESAESDLYVAVSKSRKSYAIYRALYSALKAQGKNDDAREVLNDALELSGSSGEDYFNRGMIYCDLEDADNAMEMLNKSYDKGYQAALLGMGEIAMSQNDYQTALEYYEKFFEEQSEDSQDGAILAKGYNQYAVCLMADGDYEAAVQACQNGMSYNDRDADASLMFNLMTAYEHLAQWENAYNTAKMYVEKYPDDAMGLKEYQFLESRVTQ